LEFDYVGVIIGEDIFYRDGKIQVDPSKRSSDDSTIKDENSKKINLEQSEDLMQQIIKNTYRTLMTRGMKGCYVFVVDKQLKEYIKSRLQ